MICKYILHLIKHCLYKLMYLKLCQYSSCLCAFMDTALLVITVLLQMSFYCITLGQSVYIYPPEMRLSISEFKSTTFFVFISSTFKV